MSGNTVVCKERLTTTVLSPLNVNSYVLACWIRPGMVFVLVAKCTECFGLAFDVDLRWLGAIAVGKQRGQKHHGRVDGHPLAVW